MPPKLHPLHLKAVALMAAGLASPAEIAAASNGGVSAGVARNWAKRLRLQTRQLRAAHVATLLDVVQPDRGRANGNTNTKAKNDSRPAKGIR